MNAANFFQNLEIALSNGTAHIDDPGAGGTIVVNNRGFGICEVTTLTAESRILDSAPTLPVGTELVVILKTDGGDLTLDSDDTDVVLSNAGEIAVFKVSISGTTKVWKVIGTPAMAALQTAVTRATAAAGAGLVPVSGGANRSIGAATPVEITGAITDGDSLVAPVQALLTALAAFGLITDSTT